MVIYFYSKISFFSMMYDKRDDFWYKKCEDLRDVENSLNT